MWFLWIDLLKFWESHGILTSPSRHTPETSSQGAPAALGSARRWQALTGDLRKRHWFTRTRPSLGLYKMDNVRTLSEVSLSPEAALRWRPSADYLRAQAKGTRGFHSSVSVGSLGVSSLSRLLATWTLWTTQSWGSWNFLQFISFNYIDNLMSAVYFSHSSNGCLLQWKSTEYFGYGCYYSLLWCIYFSLVTCIFGMTQRASLLL